MRLIATCMILTLLIVTSCKKDTEKIATESALAMGDFTVSTDEFSPGKTIDFTYNGNSNDIEGIYYYMVDTKAYPMDINLSKDNTASITIPDSAQAIAFNFKVNGKYDHNDKKGYLFTLNNAEGKTIPGSRSALANYVMNYGADYGIKVDKDAIYSDFKTDISSNPDIKDKWNTSFLSLIYEQDKRVGKEMINNYINELKAKDDKTEKDYTSIIRLYNTLGEEAHAESVTKEVVNKFPKGKAAKRSYFNLFYEAKSLEEKESLFEKYRVIHDEVGDIGNSMAQSLAMTYLEKDDMDRFDKYANLIDDLSSKASLFNNIAWSRAEKGEDLDFAAKVSKQSLDLIKEAQENPKNKPYYYTQSQYKWSLENSYKMYADTYALTMFKQGNIKDAIAYQKLAIGNGENGELNERYIQFLSKGEQFKTVIDQSESFIANGHATRKLKEFYKEAYMKSNKDVDEFETKLASLEKEAYSNFKEEIEGKLINEDAPDFTLKNTEGERISLASLKGKTVILDFWATWCGPCKASFPGMQEVVTKYKNDEDVVLLFVDTFESGDNREKLVTDFISKNNYDFHVIYDNPVENSRDFEVATKYGVSGIPTKVIIDKNGKIRFKSVGYSGQTEKLVNEMDIMIDILKS